MMGAGITPALVWLYVFMTDRISGIILLVTMPILIAFLILVGLAARKQTERQLDSYRMLSNHFVDSLRGLMTLKFLGQSRKHSGSIRQVSEDYRKATMRTLRVAFLSSFALDFFTMLSVASVAVNLGLRLINGSIELLPALLVLILAPEYFLPVRMVGADFHATLDGKQAGKRCSRSFGHRGPRRPASRKRWRLLGIRAPLASAKPLWPIRVLVRLPAVQVGYTQLMQLPMLKERCRRQPTRLSPERLTRPKSRQSIPQWG